MLDTNNIGTLLGEIEEYPEILHEKYGEKFYKTTVSVQRKSGTYDVIPVIFSERIVNVSDVMVGTIASIKGRFSSYNKFDVNENRRKLELIFFCQDMVIKNALCFTEESNHLFLHGFLCKKPIFRETPSGREICDVLIAVNRRYKKTDYIPCIVWGGNARFVNRLKVGTEIELNGRIQSRVYRKSISDEELVERMAYEMSVYKLDLVEGNESNER